MGKCRFNEVWIDDHGWRLWLRPGKDAHTAFCMLCKKFIDVSHSGVGDVKSHSKGKKHKQMETNLTSGKQLTLHAFNKATEPLVTSSHTLTNEGITAPRPSCSSMNSSSCSSIPSSFSTGIGINEPCSDTAAISSLQHDVGLEFSSRPRPGISTENKEPNISSFLLSDSVTKAEILWAAYCVTTHTSTRSGGLATNLFPVMFPDSNIASKLQMQKDKIAYSVTYGLGPYFENLTNNTVRHSPIFALSVDECLNDISQKQQLDVMTNYWDMEKNCCSTRYLTSAFLERSRATDVQESILSIIKEANLDLNNLIQLSTDGPNVNLKLLFDIQEHMKCNLPGEKHILDIGTCSLHIVNGAYKSAHTKTNWKLNHFLRSLYQLFKNYPSRRGIYKLITGSSVFPKKFCAVRWTENSAVIQRCLDMLPHLKKYVSEVQKNAPNSENFLTLKNVLNEDPTIEAKLHFSSMIANELEEFLTRFQRNCPLLPFLHQELFLLMKNLANRIIKKSVMDKVTSASKLKKIYVDLASNLKPVEAIDIGFGAKAALKKVKEIDAQTFRLDCQKFLKEIFTKLMDKSPLKKNIVIGATCLNPNIMANEILRESRINVAIEAFVSHNQLTPAQGDVVKREYLKLCENDFVKKKLEDFNWKNHRLDTLFGEIFFSLSQTGEGLNTNLEIFIKKILVCFHGNAAVERSFSFNKNFLVENLEEKSLVAQRHLHDYIHSLPEGLASLEVNRKMIVEFRNASSRRKDALKSKKEVEKTAIEAKKRAAVEIKSLELKKQKLLEEKSKEISEIEIKLKLLKKN